MENITPILDRWRQTGEFNNVPSDEFVETVLTAQKSIDTADTALYLCYRRYHKNNPPPANLINVLLGTPISSMISPPQWWEHVTLLYLDKRAVSVEHSSVLLQKATLAGCLPSVLDKMLGTNLAPEGGGGHSKVWKAMVLAIMETKEADLVTRLELRRCRDHFNDETIKYIHYHMKTRNPKSLAPRIAAVLPNDLPVMMRWMSLCEAQKTDVAIGLLDNMMTVEGPQSFGIEYYQSRLADVHEARPEASDLVKSWLDLYRASLHYKIGEMSWHHGNETFKIGYTELADDKKAFDDLEMWLEDPNNEIAGKGKLLDMIRTDREPGGQRKDGHIWHAILVKKLYESHLFKSIEVEQRVSGNSSLVDILLEDECGKDIHIEAWDGITEMTHSIRRMFQTGERFNINMLGQHGSDDTVFEWKHANKWLNKKASQLPQTGRNFVVAQHSQHELRWQSMDGVNLKDNICTIQIESQAALVWCKDCELMRTTAQLISKALGCKYCQMS